MHTYRALRQTTLLLLLAALLAVVLPMLASADDGAQNKPAFLPHQQGDFTPEMEQNKGAAREAPLLMPEGQGELIPGHYIVVMNSGAAFSPDIARDKVARLGGKLTHTYSAALQGFAAELPEKTLRTTSVGPAPSAAIAPPEAAPT